jgi:hypothetical protein
MAKPKKTSPKKGSKPVPDKDSKPAPAKENQSAKGKPAPAKPAAAKPDPAAPVAPDDYDPNKDRRALLELQARYGNVDDDTRAAFDELSTNDRRASLGSRTRADGVRREGVAWAVAIDQAFTRYPALIEEHYSKMRFAYFLDRLAALNAAIEAQTTRRGDQGVAQTTAGDSEQAARDARRRLLAKMRGFAGHRASERALLDEATGRTDDVEALGASIRALVKLGQTWLERQDNKSKIQAASAGLTERALNEALAAAEGLTKAATDVTLAGRRPAADAPEVNLLEGWVLHEMAEAQRCFDEAHSATRIVPRLQPGPATRHVLGPKRPRAKSDEERGSEPQAPTEAQGSKEK